MVLASTNPPLTATALKVIRAALLMGVLLFGAVIWYLHSTEAPAPVDADMARTLRLAFVIFAVSTVPLLLWVRTLQARAGAFDAAGRMAIVGWAIAEGVAILGAVIYLLTRDAMLFLAGTALLVAAYGVIPVPEPPAHD
jgi:hypothetical protein